MKDGFSLEGRETGQGGGNLGVPSVWPAECGLGSCPRGALPRLFQGPATGRGVSAASKETPLGASSHFGEDSFPSALPGSLAGLVIRWTLDPNGREI